MKPEFAKAIAANIRIIAEKSAVIALLDLGKAPLPEGYSYSGRADAVAAVDKAEATIAEILQQPGSHPLWGETGIPDIAK